MGSSEVDNWDGVDAIRYVASPCSILGKFGTLFLTLDNFGQDFSHIGT